MDINEISFLKQQVSHLNQEKVKIEQTIVVLDSRVNHSEHEVGFE